VILVLGRWAIVLTGPEVIRLAQELYTPRTPLANLSSGTVDHRILMIPVTRQLNDLDVPRKIGPYNIML
jgi:hypothetical protein